MQKYSEVLGLPVICIDTGKKLSVVKDVIFCPKAREVKAFLLERKGCQVKKKVVMLNDVASLGKDAMVVKDCTCIKNLKDIEKAEDMADQGHITGLRIYSRTGEDLGVVKDIFFNYTTGRIEGVEVSDGLLQDLVQGRNKIPLFGKVEFSKEFMVVDKEVTEEMVSTGGGLKRKILND